MARKPQSSPTPVSRYIVPRGHNDPACFTCDDDFQVFILALETAARRHCCQIHAYILMANHVRLLVTPCPDGSLVAMMCSIERRYLRYFKAQYRKTTALWAGRYQIIPVATGTELLHCCRDIEMRPVRAILADSPDRYLWSSHTHNAYGKFDPVVTHHLVYEALGSTKEKQQEAYRCMFQYGTSDRQPKEAGKCLLQKRGTSFSSRAFCA